MGWHMLTHKNLSMRLSEFRTMIKNELQDGERRIAYMCLKDNNVIGGMCYTENEALLECKNIIKKINLEEGYEFNIAVYNEDVKVFNTTDILNKIRYIM